MDHFQRKLFPKMNFPLWIRHIDETLTVFNSTINNISNIINVLNYIYLNIQVTTEVVNNKSLPFLDVPTQKEINEFSLAAFHKTFEVCISK